MGQHQEYVQNLEADGWHGEEVDRDKLLDMVVEKYPPSLAWRLSLPEHVFADASLANVNTELKQFSVDARRTPERVGPAHGSDQISDFVRDGGPPGLSVPNLP